MLESLCSECGGEGVFCRGRGGGGGIVDRISGLLLWWTLGIRFRRGRNGELTADRILELLLWSMIGVETLRTVLFC